MSKETTPLGSSAPASGYPPRTVEAARAWSASTYGELDWAAIHPYKSPGESYSNAALRIVREVDNNEADRRVGELHEAKKGN